ncbi:hypothetical protein GCM10009624_23460 [Gordonia sinesedis]
MTTSPGSTDIIDVLSPAGGERAGSVPVMTAAMVADRAAELRAHQPEWVALGPAGRARFFADYRNWLLDHSGELTRLLLAESGKVRHEAALEVSMAADLINYFARIAGHALATDTRRPHSLLGATKKLSVSYHPHPLVGVITPWNFPLAGPFMDVTPALAAGAAVLLKPSEVTPLAMLRAAEGWREIGAPDVFAAVTGAGETGAAVVDGVDFIQFTGSTTTGRRIARRAADRLIGCSLELGGKDPMIVLADADLERAANGAAWGGLFNSGQVCVSVERVYVEAPVYDEFVSLLVAKVEDLRLGHGRVGDTDVGSMATPSQLAQVERHVTEAVAAGARVLTGGTRGDAGLSYEPTVLVDVDHTMACMRDETFGPTIPVMKVATVDDAIRLANDSDYGLSASVWSRDHERALAVAARLRVGAVNVNDVIANLFSVTLPHGGWKQSGIGTRFGGEAAIRKYCRAQAVTTPRIAIQREPIWYPYTKARSAVVHRALRATVGRGRRRFTAASALADPSPDRGNHPSIPKVGDVVDESRIELAGYGTRVLETVGARPTPIVLCLHGFADHAGTWLPVMAEFARRDVTAVAVDLPGFGEADHARPGSLLTELDAFVSAAIEHWTRDGVAPVVMGNSLGAVLALRAAANPGVRLSGLVPISPAGFGHSRLLDFYERYARLNPLWFASYVPMVVVRALFARGFTWGAGGPTGILPGTAAAAAAHIHEARDLRRLLDHAPGLLRDLRTHGHHQIDDGTPGLIIWGRHDKLTKVSGAPVLGQLWPGSKAIILDDCGHCAQLERPDVVAEHVIGLLASIDLPG